MLSTLNTLHKSHIFNHQRMGHYLVILPIKLDTTSTLSHYPVAQIDFENHKIFQPSLSTVSYHKIAEKLAGMLNVPILTDFTLHHQVIRVVWHLTFTVPIENSHKGYQPPYSKSSKTQKCQVVSADKIHELEKSWFNKNLLKSKQS